MTDAELRDAAVAELKQTIRGLKGFTPPPQSHWGKALALLDQIDPEPPPPPSPNTLTGVYVGARNVSEVDNFQAWLGAPVEVVVDWHASDSWAAIEGGWSLTPWKPRQVCLAVAGWADGVGGSLAKGAAGDYDSHWTNLAQRIEADGMAGTVILRLMWEWAGHWYPHSVKSAGNAADFAAYWRRVVEAMRTVAPEIRFDWNGVTGPKINPVLSYPGDDYVDFIGFDLYDSKWGSQGTPAERFKFERERQYGINYWRDFASEHGKPLSCPEWGLLHAADQGGRGGGDNPYFIDAMADLFDAGNFAYHAYFDFDAPDGRHKLTQFPQGKARYLARFA